MVPFTWYPVKKFHMQCKHDNLLYKVAIDDGHYTPDQLAAEIASYFVNPNTNALDASFTYNSVKNRFDFTANIEIDLLVKEWSEETKMVLGRTDEENYTVSAHHSLDEKHSVSPRLSGPDMINMQTDLMLDSQNTHHYSGNRVSLPVRVPPGGVIHYSVDADEESIPLTFYQNISTIHFNFTDGLTGEKIPDTRGQPVYLRLRFHFRH